MDTQRGLGIVFIYTYTLILVVVAQFTFGYEIADVQIVYLVALALNLIQVFLREKATVGQQSLIDAAQLVDAQITVTDAPPALALLGTGEAHLVDDLKQHPVTDASFLNECGTFGIEDVRFQRINTENALNGLLICLNLFRSRIAVIDQLEQQVERFLDIVAVLFHIRIGTGSVRDLAEAFKGIAQRIDVCLHGRVSQFGLRFNEKHEQDAVHIAQTLQRQIFREVFSEYADMLTFPHIIDHFIAQHLNALTQGILQILGNARGMLVTVVVQRIKQRVAFLRADAFAMKKNRHCLKCRFLMTSEDRIKVKNQEALLVPLIAVDQSNLVQSDEHHPAGRLIHAEQDFGK